MTIFQARVTKRNRGVQGEGFDEEDAKLNWMPAKVILRKFCNIQGRMPRGRRDYTIDNS